MPLPRDAYIEQSWQDQEARSVFAHSWIFAGLEADFREPGDYLSLKVGAYPLVVLKLKDGTLATYHNICRHRGTTLLDGKGNTGKSVVCPYHRWTYALDGRLKGAPDMVSCFPDLDRASLSLKPGGLGLFKGLVFVNPDPSADFESWIDPIRDLAWPHDLAAKDIKETAPLTYDMKCNWKVYVENAIDGYHLAYLHEKTLGGPKPERNIWEQHGEHMLWYAIDEDGTRHALPQKARKEFKQYLYKPLKLDPAIRYAGVYYLFPATIIDTTPYGMGISVLEPSAPDRSFLRARRWVGPGQSKDDRKYIPGYDKATGVISSDNWTKPAYGSDFQTEDVWICEKLQEGISSPAFELGPLAKGPGAEDPIGWFHGLLNTYIGTASS